MADLKESFSKGLTALNVKTSTFLEAKKIQTYISTLNNEIEALQKEIGRRAYEDWEKNGSISLSNIGEQLMEISKKKETTEKVEVKAGGTGAESSVTVTETESTDSGK